MTHLAIFFFWVAQLLISRNSLQDKQHNQVVKAAGSALTAST